MRKWPAHAPENINPGLARTLPHAWTRATCHVRFNTQLNPATSLIEIYQPRGHHGDRNSQETVDQACSPKIFYTVNAHIELRSPICTWQFIEQAPVSADGFQYQEDAFCIEYPHTQETTIDRLHRRENLRR